MLTPLITAVFLASLLGSLHCAGMCGAFLALAVDDRGNWRRHVLLQGAYHGGRLLSYLTLGIAAGAVGRLINLGSALAGLRPAAAIVAGATVIFFASVSLLRILGVRAGAAWRPAWMTRLGQRTYRAAMRHPPARRALLIGLCTTLLPCGWLYAFVATAAGAASPLAAAVIMLVFWTGTLPMMMTLGAGMKTALGPLSRRLPVMTCVMLLIVGLYTVAGRASLDPRSLIRTIEAHRREAAANSATAAAVPGPGSPLAVKPNDDSGLRYPRRRGIAGLCPLRPRCSRRLHRTPRRESVLLRRVPCRPWRAARLRPGCLLPHPRRCKRPAKPTHSPFQSFDSPAFAKLYVQALSEKVGSVDLVLEGITCSACVWLIERLPSVLPGVIEARLSLREATVRITWDQRDLALSKIARTLDSLGYTPHPAKGASRKQMLLREDRKRIIPLAVAGALMGNTMLLALALYSARQGTMAESYRLFFRWLSVLLGGISLAWPGATFFRGAISAIRLRSVNLDVPIAMALLVGGAAGAVNVVLNRGEIYFDSLSVLVFLLLVGRFLQFRQQRRADAAVELLFSLAPATCRIVRADGQVEELPIESLHASDLVEVLSGQTIPADGVVETGESTVLQAILTGESMPVKVTPCHEVFGGSQNQGATLRIRVRCVGADSRVGKLMRVVEHGVAEKPPIVQLADRIGAWFVVVVSILAVASFAYWCRFGLSAAIDHVVALLIVTCPCVLGLATPVTLAVAIGQLARRDILVKSGAAIERLAGRGQILLDKTGTLTFGDLRLTHWHGPDDLKTVVAELEKHSQHPIAMALREAFGGERQKRAAPASPSPLSDVRETGDGGIEATCGGQTISVGSPAYFARAGTSVNDELGQLRRHWESRGNTVVLVAVNGKAVALASLGDQVRDDSSEAVATLADLGWVPSILSGDATGAVSAVARAVGIDAGRAMGEMTPEQKLDAVRLRRGVQSGPVVMVGDGVNDAAALAAADVGIAVHGGAEASLAAADVYIASPGLLPVAELVATAQGPSHHP